MCDFHAKHDALLLGDVSKRFGDGDTAATTIRRAAARLTRGDDPAPATAPVVRAAPQRPRSGQAGQPGDDLLGRLVHRTSVGLDDQVRMDRQDVLGQARAVGRRHRPLRLHLAHIVVRPLDIALRRLVQQPSEDVNLVGSVDARVC